MHFFLPLATNAQQAERIHIRIANRLTEMGYELTTHRIYQVTYKRDGKIVSETVGAASSNGEIVLAIFKNDLGYFICTYSRGAVGGEPLVARYSVVESAEFFDEKATNINQPG